jgi:Ca-activated chloride channel family protein
MDSENKDLEELLRELPMHDASEEVVSDLLEKVAVTPIQVAKQHVAKASRFETLRTICLSAIGAGFNTASTILSRRRFASLAVATCSLVLALSYSMDSLLDHGAEQVMNNVGSHLSKETRSGSFSQAEFTDAPYHQAQPSVDTDVSGEAEGYLNESSGLKGQKVMDKKFNDPTLDSFQRAMKQEAERKDAWSLDDAFEIEERLQEESFEQESRYRDRGDRKRADRMAPGVSAGGRAAGTSSKPSIRVDGFSTNAPPRLKSKKRHSLPQIPQSAEKADVMAELEEQGPYAGTPSGMQASAYNTASQFGGLQTFGGNTANLIGSARAKKQSKFKYEGNHNAVPEAKNIDSNEEVLRTAKQVFKPQKRLNKDFLKERREEGYAVGDKSDPRRDSVDQVASLARGAGGKSAGGKTPSSPRSQSLAQPANDFLKKYERTDDLSFKEAKGYWSNSYVPGSPSVRRLRAALNKQQLSSLRLPDPTLYAHDLAHQTYQPFDEPKNAALAVYLHANRKGLQGEQRVILQVGVKASERRSGRRPAMNIGVVLDLRRQPSKEDFEAMRSLLFALNKEKDIGDRFSVTVAGRAGGTLIPASKFSHGYLSVAFKNLESLSPRSVGVLNLPQAIESARAEVSRSDDPSAPLGSSSIILVTASSIQSQLRTLVQQAHSAAVEGITTSVLGVGNNLRPRELEQIALSGQGRRSILNDTNDAKSIIVKELNAVSQVVARAVRLRIRLAPGVKLIDVLGSKRLDEPAAERVRQAEKSIDQRISKNLGIEADRGEDEEGIQIVIPAFYAGDAHVVLLDVLAPGPDAIADVQLRYKDLVFMKNGVVRSNLTLSRSEAPRGQLEQNVLKNLLAFSLSEELKRCAKLMMSNQFDEARRRLEQQRKLLISFQASIPGFERDRGVQNDLLMLERYLQSLGAVSGAASAKPIALSLQFAGTQRVLPELLIE